jgi:protein SCO1
MNPRRKASLLIGTMFGVLMLCLIALGYLTGVFRPLYAPDEPIAGIGGHVRLTAHTGERIDTAAIGKPFAIFFGFTHCPDVCPTTLTEMTQTLEQLGPRAAGLRVYFVTVDPDRDTPAIMQSYMGSFDKRMIGLTGSRDEIDAVIKAYRVFARKVPTSGGDYTMDHTATTYLMDAKGRLTGTLAYQEDAPARLAKIRKLLGV